jgi:hypothetical protein
MHLCSLEDLVRRISVMSDREKEAFAARSLRLIESADFEGLSAESRARAWTALDLCTAP